MAAIAAAAIVVAGGAESSRQAGRAADKQAKAAQSATKEQRSQFDILQEQQAPFREAGIRALGQQEALVGLGTPEEQQQAFSAFSESPGQQFLRDQQERSLLRNTAAIGGLGGGNVRTALQQQAFGRAQTDFGNQFNRLASLAGGGQVATQNVGQLGAQAATNIGNLQQAGAAARASGILGQNQAQQQTLSQLVGIGAQAGLFDRNQQQPQQQPVQPASNQPQQFTV